MSRWRTSLDDRRRLVVLDAELLERRAPEARAPIRRSRGAGSRPGASSARWRGCGRRRARRSRTCGNSCLDHLDDLQGGVAVVDADADHLAPCRRRRRAARRGACRRRSRRVKPNRAASRIRSTLLSITVTSMCLPRGATWSTTCPNRPKPITSTWLPLGRRRESSGSGSGRACAAAVEGEVEHLRGDRAEQHA